MALASDRPGMSQQSASDQQAIGQRISQLSASNQPQSWVRPLPTLPTRIEMAHQLEVVRKDHKTNLTHIITSMTSVDIFTLLNRKHIAYKRW